MRNGEHARTGLLLDGVHPLPQVLRILAVVLRERNDLIGLRLAVAEDNVAMQVVAAGPGGPLESNKRGELAWLVVFLSSDGNVLPDGARQSLVTLKRIQPRNHSSAPRVVRVPAFSAFDEVVQPAAEFRL